jgi:CRP/FNR family transcriptional regulator, cyclic AMP receptor protein
MDRFMAPQPDLDLQAELRLIAAFAELSKEALVEIAAASAQRRVHAGTSLVEQGLPSPSMVVLLRGAAKVTRTTLGESGESVVVLDVMRAPCVVGDVSVIDGQPAAATVATLRSSHIATIDRRVVQRLATSHPSFARALLARAAQELRAHTRRIDEIVGGPVDERIKHLLDSLAEQHGTPLGQGRFIAIPLRRRDLACMVNATTETVSRLLAKFEREGFARSTRDGIWWRATPKAGAEPHPSSGTLRAAPAPHLANASPATGLAPDLRPATPGDRFGR